jgi:type I restriction enzyme S subunit
MDGEFRIYLWAGETAVLNQRACKFVPKFDFVPHLYIYGMMKPHLHYYENVNVGTTVVHLGKSDLDDIKIPIPPKDVLIKFGEIVNPLFEKFKINYNQIRTLEKLRDTLLPKLMSGEVRVKLEQQEASI